MPEAPPVTIATRSAKSMDTILTHGRPISHLPQQLVRGRTSIARDDARPCRPRSEPTPTSPIPTRTSPAFRYATFQRLRDTDPVSWWPEHDGGKGFWAITRYDDLLHVSRNVETFSSAQGITLEEMDPDDFEARRNMLEYDPPEHTRYRRLVSKPFSRREVYAYENGIRLLARTVVDEALASGAEFDFVERIAKQLPMRMLGRAARCSRRRTATGWSSAATRCSATSTRSSPIIPSA